MCRNLRKVALSICVAVMSLALLSENAQAQLQGYWVNDRGGTLNVDAAQPTGQPGVTMFRYAARGSVLRSSGWIVWTQATGQVQVFDDNYGNGQAFQGQYVAGAPATMRVFIHCWLGLMPPGWFNYTKQF